MKKTIKVNGHVRPDGSVVESHNRIIDSIEPNSLTKEIKTRKSEEVQASLLETLFEEK